MQKLLFTDFNLDIQCSENKNSFNERFNKNNNIESINKDLKEVKKTETKYNKTHKKLDNEISYKNVDKIETNNIIFQFFYTTIEYLKKNFNNNRLYRTNNYISKMKYNLENGQSCKENNKYDEYKFNSWNLVNNKNYNYFVDIFKNTSIINNYKNKFNEINYHNNELEMINNAKLLSFIPSNLNKKSSEEIIPIEKDKCKKEGESASASFSNSPIILEKFGNDENLFPLNQLENKNENKSSKIEEENYLVEMFGKKGWICILCNNFNYETRLKCNRCGIRKKPKRIIGYSKRTKIKVFKEAQKIEEPNYISDKNVNNKKGDWLCSFCKNLNYSFRKVCNRCQVPKVYSLINTQFTNQNKNMIDNNNYNSYEESTSIIVINNMSNININNFNNIRGKDI